MSQLKPGTRLKSAVCATEVMVIAAPEATCRWLRRRGDGCRSTQPRAGGAIAGPAATAARSSASAT